MDDAISSILITEGAIRKRIRELGGAITETYDGQPLTLVVLSNGAMIFGADLARAIRTPLHLDTLGVRSYEGTESSGNVSVYGDLKLVVTNRRVVVVYDILDSGRTLKTVVEHLQAAGAKDVKT
jgi:hypoxanthine phosphoribosyltransferase